MLTDRTGVVERAFQIAGEGTCACVSDVAKTLYKEGYDNAGAHLFGPMINRQLKALIAKAPSSAQ